jgi:tmRNA-binding protein
MAEKNADNKTVVEPATRRGTSISSKMLTKVGIALNTEVKFFRAGRANLVESYAEYGGIVLINAYLPASSSSTCRTSPAGHRTRVPK